MRYTTSFARHVYSFLLSPDLLRKFFTITANDNSFYSSSNAVMSKSTEHVTTDINAASCISRIKSTMC